MTIEYKTDWSAARTGNAFIELISVDSALCQAEQAQGCHDDHHKGHDHHEGNGHHHRHLTEGPVQPLQRQRSGGDEAR